MIGEANATQYRSFYPGSPDEFILNADAKRFPIRGTAAEAARDAQLFWHREGEFITPYRIEGDTVTALEVKVKRRTEVMEVTR